jgi:hypothetical protein
MTRLPDELLDLAATQHGVLARWQLRRLLSRPTIDNRVARGELDRLDVGIYALPGTSRPEQPAIAAALRARPLAILTGPFVLAHHRIDHFRPDAPFEVLVRPGRRIRGAPFPYRVDPLPERGYDLLGDVRLATPVDALVESALFRPQVRDRSLRLAKDQLAWRNLADAGALRRRLDERGPDDPAVMAFLEAMDGAELHSESEGERGLGGALTRLDPAPEPQVWVTPHRRVDWYLRLLRLAWEYLGDVDHASVGARRADAARDDELRLAGIRVLYVTKQDLRDPAALIATIMGAVAARADELGVPAPVLRPA